MKAHEIRQLTVEEIKKRIQDEEVNRGHLKFQLATRQLASPILVRASRRNIARLKTILNEKLSQENLKIENKGI
ncbi:MAG: 50S ribosomal protein L29 [Bacteroidetes bacterium]|jgi:large subunit ribosomal protein L29|nr:50S ribosomal protein L29 [Bacteroidota bacterium]MBU1422235.1 50S ribosomal protein L29 [Bacteroidota bacterium]MBU2471494.1 50S ribosomal protein L29 [Bacteroidota bacterium]MBU2636100.1 50S ribosomal protein L29 [Bacteroidota bacterium]MDI6779234.1 50S ribosomal protein L29 [Bacteroidota bacterium]